MTRSRLLIILAALLTASLACNMPRLVIAEPTRTPLPTLPATHTRPPASATPTRPPLPEIIPPVPTAADTPTPTAETGSGTLAVSPPPGAVTEPPPPTLAPTSTPGYPTPEDRALFEGVFSGGRLSFRIGANSASVIPKSVTLKGAACKEGGKINQSITFEPPPAYAIDKGRFTISYDGVVTIFGLFQSRERAAGNITLKLFIGNDLCTVGPLPWAATAAGP